MGWQGIDAHTLARGGIVGLERLDQSPAAPAPPGLRFQAGQVWHFAGAPLITRRLSLQRGTSSTTWSVGVEQLHSDVHHEQDVALAVQRRHRGVRLGIALGWRELHFAEEPTYRQPVVRLGAGVQPWERLHLVLAAEEREQQPHLTLALAADLEGGIDVALQLQRQPSLPMRWRFSLQWHSTGSLAALAGYDAVTSSFSGGVALRAAAWSFTFGSASHPELGTSQAWMLGWQR